MIYGFSSQDAYSRQDTYSFLVIIPPGCLFKTGRLLETLEQYPRHPMGRVLVTQGGGDQVLGGYKSGGLMYVKGCFRNLQDRVILLVEFQVAHQIGGWILVPDESQSNRFLIFFTQILHEALKNWAHFQKIKSFKNE